MANAIRQWSFTDPAWAGADCHQGERLSNEGSHAGTPTGQSPQCTTPKRQPGDFGVGLAAAGRTPIRGNTVCLYLSGGTLHELKALFEKLSEGADVTEPLKEQFFGTYGALNDKFEVRWMFVTNKKA
jgi:hypothetical protein